MAISTTGQPHRLGFLETCVKMWFACSPRDSTIVVTVDGDEDEAAEVYRRIGLYAKVYRIDQELDGQGEIRRGVAANKNTGIELLMDTFDCTHLFLSDDDIHPLYQQSLDKHMSMTYLDMALPHSMVNWGKRRVESVDGRNNRSMWTWPRGSMLYLHRDAVYAVGGMVEEFGAGGHEHVEYSHRIHNAGLTPAPFISPASYATRHGMGAAALWHAEDMPRAGEPLGNTRRRRRAITTIVRGEEDWKRIDPIMARQSGSSDYIGFRAHENGRASATLCSDMPSQGADK